MKLLRDVSPRFILLAACFALFTAPSFAATLTVKTKAGVGSYLVDDKGMALYLFRKDMPHLSMCGAANGCLSKWPVFFASSVDRNTAIDRTAVGTLTRDDGLKQTTYKGHPLYYYYKDRDSNDVYGQGVGQVWFVVSP